jgi:predicted HTH domain antitoxin
MDISMPPELEQSLSAAEARMHFAVGLFAGEKVTLGQGAAIAGISQADFLRELGARKIPVHYGLAELEEDIAAVETMLGGHSR